jgi:hypothetical protein
MAFRLNTKQTAPVERIKLIEQAIAKAKEYLETGKHAHWVGFRPLFDSKFRNGKELPPHKDWVKNVFLPRMEKALRREEKLAERLDKKEQLSRKI